MKGEQEGASKTVRKKILKTNTFCYFLNVDHFKSSLFKK